MHFKFHPNFPGANELTLKGLMQYDLKLVTRDQIPFMLLLEISLRWIRLYPIEVFSHSGMISYIISW